VPEELVEKGEDEDADADEDAEEPGDASDDDVDDDNDADEPADDNPDDGEDDDDAAPVERPSAAVPCDWEQAWEGYECALEDGSEDATGTQQCILIDGEEFWTPCTSEPAACVPGEGEDYGCGGDICTWNGEAFEWYSWWEDDCATPLVMNFERGPVEFAPVAAATFDLSTNGTCTNTAWPTSPWLALDRDGDGMIRSGAELFGSAAPMSSGGFAQNGFASLAELDSNLDGKISAADARFSELMLWSDFDEDRIGAYAELRPLSESPVVSIDLGFTRRAQCDSAGNCGVERASFEYRQGDRIAFGEVVDVHLPCQ
jgi:hypothetical protein